MKPIFVQCRRVLNVQTQQKVSGVKQATSWRITFCKKITVFIHGRRSILKYVLVSERKVQNCSYYNYFSWHLLSIHLCGVLRELQEGWQPPLPEGTVTQLCWLACRLHGRTFSNISNFVILEGLVVLRKLLCHVPAVTGRHCVTLWLFSNCLAGDVYVRSIQQCFLVP